jgi:hypothetical protein
MLFGNGSHVELLGSGRNGLRRPTHRDDVSRYSRVFADSVRQRLLVGPVFYPGGIEEGKPNSLEPGVLSRCPI